MGLHEMAIGGVYVSPLLIFGLLALPITKGVLVIFHKLGLTRWVWHEMLFICAIYLLVFTFLTLIIGIFF
ncbi:DUF1656 domain-containing protein [Entomomonas moraniae]|uniref:DUF1656 domain-containing protein n=1 Tax=Entomomonas moraniae TaxID=2213226 RepID=A0A3Q9JI64_9GAMM|nr:DUF1656 domain-containing protein [Entomomonas moraniae]AZS50149.1 DUF1656 domain-containing protein [Entomomonas moraniae]